MPNPKIMPELRVGTVTHLVDLLREEHLPTRQASHILQKMGSEDASPVGLHEYLTHGNST